MRRSTATKTTDAAAVKPTHQAAVPSRSEGLVTTRLTIATKATDTTIGNTNENTRTAVAARALGCHRSWRGGAFVG